MQIQLSEHFTYKKLLRFVLPSIVMMIFTSIYGVVDGLFVSNYVGKTAFAAVNLIMPFLMAISALGFMIGTGGSAIVAKTLGEGKKEQANEYFSMLVYITLIGGIVLSALGILFSPLIARGLGADGALLTNCVLYARITLLSMPAFMLQNVFQSFFCHRRKTKTWSWCHRHRGCHQYGSGLFTGRSVPDRSGRCGICNGHQRMYRRSFSDPLFCTQKFQPS